jgi:hypothetical protein
VRNTLEGVKNTEFYCPGSLLRMMIDQKNPIAQGMPPEQAAFFVNGRAFDIDESAGMAASVVASYASRDVLMSGWITGESRIAGKPAIVRVKSGEGQVVLFGFSPIFRGQPHGTFKLLFNALMASTSQTQGSR